MCALRLMLTLSGFAVQIENLQEQLRDKEKQMSSLKERVKSLQADTSNTDTALTTLEESLAEKVRLLSHFLFYFLLTYLSRLVVKEGRVIFVFSSSQERIIERLKEQRDRDDREKTEELDCTKKELKELKERLSLIQGDLSDREVSDKQKRLPFGLFYDKHTSETSSGFFISFLWVSHGFLHQNECYLGQFILTAVGVCLCRRPC